MSEGKVFKKWKLIFLQNQYNSEYLKSLLLYFLANKKTGKGI